MLTLYGIANCDTVKKARRWLADAGLAHRFHDYKTAGAPEAELRGWIERLGWEAVLNRSGTTFRKLPDAEKQGLDADRAMRLMLAHPSAIKRPVLATGDTLLLGFAPERYSAALSR